MRAVRSEPDINSRRHITAVKAFYPVVVNLHAHKVINNVYLLYDCRLIIISLTPYYGGPLSVDKLVESFKNPNIPPIDGEPTCAILHAMQKLLNSNATSVSTNLGCSTLGHLCLTLSPTVYTTLSTTRVVPPSQSWRNAPHTGRRDRPQSSVHPIRTRRGDVRLQHLLERRPRPAPTTSWLRQRHVPTSPPHAALQV